MLELVPPRIGPHLLKVRLFQHGWHDGRQRLRVRFILLAARQDHRLREAVHRVGVLRDNGVEQPRARRLYHVAALLAPAVAQILPVPQAVPLLVGDDARLERALAVLVPAQKLRAARHVVRRDHGRGHVRPGRLCRTCRRQHRRRIRRAVGHGVRFLVCHRLSFAAVSGEMVYITCCILREKETAVAVFSCLHNQSLLSGSNTLGVRCTTGRGAMGSDWHRYRISSAMWSSCRVSTSSGACAS